MGYSSWGHKESDTTEVSKHACVHAAQRQRNKQPNQKMAEDLDIDISPKKKTYRKPTGP